MANKFFAFIASLLFMTFGFGMLNGGVTWRQVNVPPWVGYFSILFGMLCLVGAAITKDSDGATMCPRCDEAHHWKLMCGRITG